MAKPAPLSIVPQMDEERPAINVQTEEALQKLLNALEARQTRTFDPRLLAMGRAFLTPSPSGSSFEGIGRAAQAYATEDEAMRQEDIDVARQRLEILGQMGQMQRAGMRDQAVRSVIESLGEPPPMAGAKPPAAPIPGEPEPGSEAYAPAGFSGPGIRVMQGNPALLADRRLALDARQRLRLAQTDPNVNIADEIDKINEADRKAMEAQKKRYEVRENGVIDLATGLLFQYPKGSDPVERQIYGNTYEIPPYIAAILDFHQGNNNTSAYDAVLKNLGIPIGAEEGKFKSKAERETERIIREETAKKEAAVNVEAESALGANSKSAREMFNAAQRLQKAVSESALVFGVLQSPGIGTAVLSLIDEGIQAGNTSIRLGGLQSSIIKSLPNVTQKDITNLERAYSALAEIELKYTQLYLKGQGQVTEGERKVVRDIAGTPRNNPDFLRSQAKLIQMRSQFDIDVIDEFRRLKEKDPGMTWTRFQRSSGYRNMENNYDKNLAKAFNLEAAVPTSERKTESMFSVDAFQEALRKRQ